MKINDPCMKAPLKGELLRRVTRRYPNLDTATIEVVSHIQSIARSLSAGMNRDLAVYGLTEGKFYVLSFLFSEDLLGHEDPSPSDIADNLGITRGTVTGLLDGLERDGYLERTHDTSDRRALTIRMTNKAHQFLDRFIQTKTICGTQGLPLNAEEMRTMIEWLSRIELALRTSDTD